MLLKGIIEDIIDEYTVKVRIPVMHGAPGVSGSTPTKNLLDACTCVSPTLNITYHIGDIVILGFEHDDQEKPIILGFLYSGHNILSMTDITTNSLKVATDIQIGESTMILEKFNFLENQIAQLNDIISDLKSKLNSSSATT